MLRDSTTPTTTTASSPTTTKSPKPWWNPFGRSAPKQPVGRPPYQEDNLDHPVFGKTLQESLGYASVQISTADGKGNLYVWGNIPVVVAKCGMYLKEHATEVQGTFRVNGSTKRMRDLQAAFETPPRYGKSLDWRQESYTTHDVASVFRRYLTQMPEPVIPHDMYHLFRDALAKEPYNQERIISTYQALIRRLPVANQYLLLYVLDLLSVFARKSDKNLMTAANLAVIFRPGLISHPQHEMSPQEHALSQRVLEFLIAQQDWFMLDIAPPPVGEPGPSASNGGGTGPGNKDGENGWGGNGANGGRLREAPTTPTRQNTWTPGEGRGGSAEAGPGPSSQMLRSLTNRKPQTNSAAISSSPVAPTASPKSPPQPKRANTTPYTSPVSASPPIVPNTSKAQTRTHVTLGATATITTPSAASPPQPKFAPHYSSPPSQTHPNPESHAHSAHGRLTVTDATSHSKPWTSSQLWTSPPTHYGPSNVPAVPKVTSANRRPFSIGSGSTMVDEMMVIPSSDEEFARLSAVARGGGHSGSAGPGGSRTSGGSAVGWGGSGFLRSGKEKERHHKSAKDAEREREKGEKKEKEQARAEKERIKMMRRRTTMDPRSDLKLIPPILESPSLSEGGGLSGIIPPASPAAGHPDHAHPNGNGVHFNDPSSPPDPQLSPKADVKRSRTLPSSMRRRGSLKGSIVTVEDEYLLVGSHAGLGYKGTYARDQEREKENLNYAKEREKRVLKKHRRVSGAAVNTPNGGS